MMAYGSWLERLTDMWTLTKQCNVCKVRKDIKDFHVNKSCRLGVTGTCRLCNSDRIRSWYGDNRERRQLAANSRNQKRRDEAIDYLGGKCMRCGGVFPRCVYDFHHRDPATKIDSISNLLGKPKMLKEELKKCDLLCANCHRIRHFEEGA